MDHHCYGCGREIEQPGKAVAVLVIESYSGRIGMAHLDVMCASQPNLVRYRQTINWDHGATLANLARFKALHGRIAAINGSASGSVPIFLA
jgi:hypothetical protein